MVSFNVFKGSKEGKIIKSTSNREIRPGEVLMRITHSGLCGTDEHFKHKDMGLGHEGVGVVQVEFKAHNTRITTNYHEGCRRRCHNARQRRQRQLELPSLLLHAMQILPHRPRNALPATLHVWLSRSRPELLGLHAIWREAFLFCIPPSMERRDAAPLMCGSATVFNSLARFGAKPTGRVGLGIIGIGGLGHLAIQFTSKMGCDIVVSSQTESKNAEAIKTSASELFTTKDVKELNIRARIDHLLVCTSQQPEWKLFLPIMAPNRTVYLLTVSADESKMPYYLINALQLKVQGSLVAPRQLQGEMLEFAARHGIRPIVEEFPLKEEGIMECIERLEEGKIRYRGVLVAQ
jgi:D-arabinose 1-dehydrogenase-like Zn-dependent alcohol dehydrogenase